MSDTTPHDCCPGLPCLPKYIAVIFVLCISGCAALPYRYGQFHASIEDTPAEVRFEYGKPQKTLDNLAWFTGIWSRLLPLNSYVNRHAISENTQQKLVGYLEDNDLSDVLVRVNQYDPKGEWRRLRVNHRIGPGWRYTAGVVSLIHYTVIPGRIFGGDQYNAFTNTLYINSDVAAVVMHEAAYAKDVHSRRLPGSYAFVSELPVICLWRHTKGVNDILGYARTNDDWIVERDTYRVVYPQMGVRSTMMTGTFVPFWDGILLSVAGAAAGHATGQVAIAQRNRERRASSEDEPVIQVHLETEETDETDKELIDKNSSAKGNPLPDNGLE